MEPQPRTALSDSELIRRYKVSNDTGHVGELYLRYAHLVLGTCLKYLKDMEESKDATMGIFEQLLTKLKQHEVSHFKSWLYTLAKNECLMRLRKKRPQVAVKNEHLTLIDVESESKYHQTIGEEDEKNLQLDKMHREIEQLRHEQKTCIKLFYLEKKTYKEISRDTEFSVKEVKSHIQNGKRNLRKSMVTNG